MTVVDFESAWYALKARLSEKRSWGTSQIAESMAEIEVQYRLPESAGFDDRPLPIPHGNDPRELHEPVAGTVT